MVSLPHSVPRGAHSSLSFFAGVASAIVDFCEMIGASARVAQAVEARRSPRSEDLQILGIKGPLPKTW